MADILSRPVTVQDLIESKIYNTFPHDTEQPSKDDLQPHLQYFSELIEEFGLGKTFAIHLLHKHWTLPQCKAIYGEQQTATISFWMSGPTAFDDITLSKTRPHNICVSPDGKLITSEFRAGNVPGVNIDPKFVAGFIKRIQDHKLEKIFGLQALPEEDAILREVVFETCAVMLDTKDVASRVEGIDTGWRVDEGKREMTAYETHTIIDGKHVPVNAGAPRSSWQVESCLREKGYLIS